VFLKIAMIVSIAFCLYPATTRAQGGWDVWTISLRDGKSFDASPVWGLDAKELKYGFHQDGTGHGTPVARRMIRLMTNNLNNSEYRRKQGADFKMPAVPKSDFKQDLVVLDDGRRVFGPVKIVAEPNKLGRPDIYNPVLVQNGTKTALTRVAYIKFASIHIPARQLRR
jgi:hypothetical protein